MSLLPIILLLSTSLFAEKITADIEKLFHKHVKQVSMKKADSSLYTESFQSILADDKIIFKGCAGGTCKTQVTVEKMSHRPNYYKVRLNVTQANKKRLPHRQGCYFVDGLKIDNYIEDCDAR